MQTTLTYLFLVGTIIVGCLYCFRGNKSLQTFIGIYAFFTGTSWVRSILLQLGAGLTPLWIWILAIIAGVALAILAFAFLKFAFFLAGGLMGIALFRLIVSLNPATFGTLSSGMQFVIGLLFFIVLGVLTVAAQRHLVIWGTSIWGAYTVTAASGIVFGLLIHPNATPPALGTTLSSMQTVSLFQDLPAIVPVVILIALALAGIIYQYRHTKKK